MTTWRPAPFLRFKALGLHWRDHRLLAAEVLENAGGVKGVRPLGGSVAFGATAEAAVIRKFREELGIPVEGVGPPIFMENIYPHEGSIAHEVLAIFEVKFAENAFKNETRIAFHEDHGVTCFAEWFALETLDLPDQPRPYPDRLKARLLQTR